MTAGRTPLVIAPDHPAFAGHFPGTPIVPGVVLLDEALHAIGNQVGTDLSTCRISAVKFLSPVRPGEPLCVSHEVLDNRAVRFEIMSGERKIAIGSIHLSEVEQ